MGVRDEAPPDAGSRRLSPRGGYPLAVSNREGPGSGGATKSVSTARALLRCRRRHPPPLCDDHGGAWSPAPRRLPPSSRQPRLRSRNLSMSARGMGATPNAIKATHRISRSGLTIRPTTPSAARSQPMAATVRWAGVSRRLGDIRRTLPTWRRRAAGQRGARARHQGGTAARRWRWGQQPRSRRRSPEARTASCR